MKRGVIAGNFDVIHPGYIDMFNECKEHCDLLVVGLHEDPSIERPDKLTPVLSWIDRWHILESLQQVDFVFLYKTEADLHDILSSGKFDVRFLGSDYIDKPFTGDDLDIPIHFLNRDHDWSTTKFKQMIADSLPIKNKVMTFPEFEEIVDKMVAGSKTLDAAYNLKIDLFEMLNDHHCVVDKLWGHILTEPGEEWLWWYMYEKNGISGTPRADMTANDEDGTEICEDLKGLYDYLVKYNHFKINNNEI